MTGSSRKSRRTRRPTSAHGQCHAFFVPGAAEKDLKAKVTEQHIDITKVDGGCWVYGPRWKLERTMAAWGVTRA